MEQVFRTTLNSSAINLINKPGQHLAGASANFEWVAMFSCKKECINMVNIYIRKIHLIIETEEANGFLDIKDPEEIDLIEWEQNARAESPTLQFIPHGLTMDFLTKTLTLEL